MTLIMPHPPFVSQTSLQSNGQPNITRHTRFQTLSWSTFAMQMPNLMYLKSLRSSLTPSNSAVFSLRWNWGGVLLFALIWSYGFENFSFSNSVTQAAFTTILMALVILIVDFLSNKYQYLYTEEFHFTFSDIAIFCLYATLLIACGIYGSNSSLVGDQLYHAQSSQIQSISIAEGLIHRFIQIPASIKYKTIIEFVNWIMLLGTIFFVAYVRRLSHLKQISLIILLFFALKTIFTFKHLFFVDPHPPLRLLPLWIGSAIFGITDVSFRLGSLVSLSVFAFVIYKFSQRHLDRPNSFLVGLSVSSIPLLWHVSSVVEQSVWTALSWSFILISIQESSNNPKYTRWISVIVIASLMRASAFVALVPIFIMMGVEYLKPQTHQSIKKYLIYAAPVLVLIPFLGKTLVIGTPSTAGQEASLHKIISSFENGFSINALYYNILLPWIVFLPLSLLPICRNWLKTSTYAIFFVLAYCIFYSINPGLWGIPRYQAELGIPFVILGFYNVVLLANSHKTCSPYIKHVLTALILFNVALLTHLDWINPPVDNWSGYFSEVKTGNVKILSSGEGDFNIREALQAVKSSGYSKNVCKVGVTYGTFSEVMSGFSIDEVQNARMNYPDCSNSGELNIQQINDNPHIKLILFVEDHKKKDEIRQLINTGQWVAWKNFYNEKYGSTIIGIVRQ